MMSGKEFPNNWQGIFDSDDEEFGTCTFEELIDGITMFAIPSSHNCILRCENKRTGKVKEYAYRREHAAVKRLQSLCQDPDNSITICTDEAIYQLEHKPIIHPFDDPFFL